MKQRFGNVNDALIVCDHFQTYPLPLIKDKNQKVSKEYSEYPSDDYQQLKIKQENLSNCSDSNQIYKSAQVQRKVSKKQINSNSGECSHQNEAISQQMIRDQLLQREDFSIKTLKKNIEQDQFQHNQMIIKAEISFQEQVQIGVCSRGVVEDQSLNNIQQQNQEDNQISFSSNNFLDVIQIVVDQLISNSEDIYEEQEVGQVQENKQTFSNLNIKDFDLNINLKQEDIFDNLIKDTILKPKNDEMNESYKQSNTLENNENENLKELFQDTLARCTKYRSQYQKFNQLHRSMQNNQCIQQIVDEIRNPIIKRYVFLKDKYKALSFKFEKEMRSKMEYYQNEQFHCMCSLKHKFTKLSSLHNHIKREHPNTPLWCWQLKLSPQVGRPNKEIPNIESNPKQKKVRFEDRAMKILNINDKFN